MAEIIFHPIGVIHSPFLEVRGTPIQSVSGKEIKGTVELYHKYVEGLKDLDGFTYIILLYFFHLVEGYSLLVSPYLDEEKHGMFSTRIPSRPNPIGLSIVRLNEIKGNTLFIEDLDIIDGTLLLDIKPYVPEFDVRTNCNIGWLTDKISKVNVAKSDGRLK